MQKITTAENAGLSFFGSMSASISHEIKNTLAIINENAGLLEDLTLLAEKGAPLPGERLRRLSQVIKKQVDRADGIVRKMNRFSHSIDAAVQPVNLYETVVFVMDLCDRLIRLRNSEVTVLPTEDPVVVSSSLFHLEHLIWRCVESAIGSGDRQTVLRIAIEKTPGGASIRMKSSPAAPLIRTEMFGSSTDRALQQILGARIHLTEENGEVQVILPQNLD